MPLASKCLSFQGELGCFKPGYGWGWSRLDKTDEYVPVDYPQIEQAGLFRIRVHRFFSFQGELRGIVGLVEQPRHLFDGFWIVAAQMHGGEFDLTDKLCLRWDIELGPGTPTQEEWQHIRDVSPIYSGFGILASSEEVLAAEVTKWQRK